MDILHELRNTFKGCITTSCRKRDCSLNLDGIDRDQIVIIDNDRCNASGEQLCDYIIFYRQHNLTITAAEFKSGRIHASEAVEQIKNGAKKADDLSHGHEVHHFIPILLRGRRSNTADIKRVQRSKIPFRGRNLLIVIKRCGDSFRSILREVLPI